MVRDSIVVVNPHPDGDRVECRLSAGDGEVEVVLGPAAGLVAVEVE